MTRKSQRSNTGLLLGLGFAITLAMTAFAPTPPAAAGGKLGKGMTCSSDSDCKSGSCGDHICSGGEYEKVGEGGKCKTNGDCENLNCRDGACSSGGGGTNSVGTGGKCHRGSDCKSDDCSNGVCR